jgi:hypothetical protein
MWATGGRRLAKIGDLATAMCRHYQGIGHRAGVGQSDQQWWKASQRAGNSDTRTP